jgi:hypothetical protein
MRTFVFMRVHDFQFQGCETAAYPPTNMYIYVLNRSNSINSIILCMHNFRLPPPDEYIIDLDLPQGWPMAIAGWQK